MKSVFIHKKTLGCELSSWLSSSKHAVLGCHKFTALMWARRFSCPCQGVSAVSQHRRSQEWCFHSGELCRRRSAVSAGDAAASGMLEVDGPAQSTPGGRYQPWYCCSQPVLLKTGAMLVPGRAGLVGAHCNVNLNAGEWRKMSFDQR